MGISFDHSFQQNSCLFKVVDLSGCVDFHAVKVGDVAFSVDLGGGGADLGLCAIHFKLK